MKRTLRIARGSVPLWCRMRDCRRRGLSHLLAYPRSRAVVIVLVVSRDRRRPVHLVGVRDLGFSSSSGSGDGC